MLPQLPTPALSETHLTGGCCRQPEALDSRANNSAATHEIGASRSGWKMQEQLGGWLVE